MSNVFFLLFFLTNFYTAAICHTKCKEYLIIIKETSCPTNSTLIREAIKLDDVELNHDNCSEESLKILSSDESYSNKSYVIKFDYIGFESVCVPIIKSSKLLEHIKIDENITTNENKEFGKDRHQIDKTTVIENNTIKKYPLECLIKDYKQTCDKKESKETLKNEIKKIVNINLIHANKPTSNITEFIYNNTEASILFEQCVLNNNLCTNSNKIHDYTENSDTILQIKITSIGNKDSSVFLIMNNSKDNFNCTNIINKYKNINVSHIKALTSSIITKYYCQDEKIDDRNLTLPIFDVSLYISIDLNILNTKLRYINCTEKFKHENSTELSIDCNVDESVEMQIKKDNYTTTSGNNSLPEIDLFEGDFNQSLVYHCKLKKVNITRESYSEDVELFNTYTVFDYQTCTEEYSTDDKKAHLDGSKVLFISGEVYKDNFTNSEDFESNASKSLKLHFLHNNVSDCSERLSLNISKGRIISQWPDKQKSNNGNMTITVETPTSKSPIENKNVNLSDHHNDVFNVHNKVINATTKKTKENYFDNEHESKDEGKIRDGKKLLKENATSKTDTSRDQLIQRDQIEDNDPLQEMYYVSPKVYITAVVALLAAVGSVLIYALCLFKKKEHEYQATPKRDWSEMDVTEF
ncbi:unnamed protein product [Arctia plantaginis]|uniref:Uncharacterized protein n=1 Tax=Arctia plantaginis TaxID=874455 RepID=A0A8S1A145_ARCPL|nr:unnamed protein product [Arctia plantaginis]